MDAYHLEVADQAEIDLYLFVVFATVTHVVVATHIVAFVLILRQAIKEKPVAGCHSNMKS